MVIPLLADAWKILWKIVWTLFENIMDFSKNNIDTTWIKKCLSVICFILSEMGTDTMEFGEATVDRTGNTESALMASSTIEGGNSIKAVLESLQTVGKYSWLLFIPTLDSQHQFWKSVQGKYVNFRMFNNLVSKVGFYIDNSLIHMAMTISKYFNVKDINLLVLKDRFYIRKYVILVFVVLWST